MIVLRADCVNIQIHRLTGEQDPEFLRWSAGSRTHCEEEGFQTHRHLELFPRKGLVWRPRSLESSGSQTTSTLELQCGAYIPKVTSWFTRAAADPTFVPIRQQREERAKR